MCSKYGECAKPNWYPRNTPSPAPFGGGDGVFRGFHQLDFEHSLHAISLVWWWTTRTITSGRRSIAIACPFTFFLSGLWPCRAPDRWSGLGLRRRRSFAQHERRRRGPPRPIGPQPRRGSRIPARGAAPKARQPRATPARTLWRPSYAPSPSMCSIRCTAWRASRRMAIRSMRQSQTSRAALSSS